MLIENKYAITMDGIIIKDDLRTIQDANQFIDTLTEDQKRRAIVVPSSKSSSTNNRTDFLVE